MIQYFSTTKAWRQLVTEYAENLILLVPSLFKAVFEWEKFSLNSHQNLQWLQTYFSITVICKWIQSEQEATIHMRFLGSDTVSLGEWLPTACHVTRQFPELGTQPWAQHKKGQRHAEGERCYHQACCRIHVTDAYQPKYKQEIKVNYMKLTSYFNKLKHVEEI
jgi:hypothetical protein